jgi:hypothetical protein
LLAIPGTAHAIPVNACGTTIAAAGGYELVMNLNCPVGVTIDADFVTFDLFGFRISGQGTGTTGIEVTGGSDDVFIRGPGTIRGFDTGIEGGDCAQFLAPSPTRTTSSSRA